MPRERGLSEDEAEAFSAQPRDDGSGLAEIGCDQQWVVSTLLESYQDLLLRDADLPCKRADGS